MDDFKSKIQTWRESTTTSPSGRHLGRYKALFATIHDTSEEPTPDDPLTFADKQDLIAQLKLSIINYCLRNTYVLHRWKKVINVMIMKEPGNHKIHRLRVLHLYEADYNAICAIHWRKLLRFADAKQMINEGQYGGRPGCEAQSLTLLEELKYDISYMSRRSLFNFDHDASSCYDRIIVPLASLVNRKYGMSRYVVALHAATLREAQFHLKTANGISEQSYSHCAEYPIHGTGQGSGNSPCIWLFISSTLYDAHARRSNGANFVSPDGSVKSHQSMVGFVDDATGSCNDFRPQDQLPLPLLFKRMSHDAQLWNDLLYCSGGKLELEKCSFHLLHFEFLPNGRPLPSIHHYNGAIQLIDAETKETIPIQSKRATTTHKTLGHHKAPAANRPDISSLQAKANRLATLISMSPITRQGAQLAYHTVFIPTIKYTLPQSYYSQTTLDSAQAAPHSRLIAKCGFNRHTARALIYAPKQYAGAGFVPWYALQGEGQVMQFLKQWRTSTIVSETLQITLSWAQWQAGYPHPILEHVQDPIPHLECRWFRSLRTFLASVQGQLVTTNSFVQRKERRNDIYIMEFARTSGLFNEDDMKVLNYCRLYLHVTTVSELLEANGVDMIPSLYQCQREPWFNPATVIALQRRPSQHQIRSKWQRLCRQWFTSQGKLAASMTMGRWIQPGNRLRRRRSTYRVHNPPYDVFHWRHGCYWKYAAVARNSKLYTPVGPTTWQPIGPCTPVSIQGNDRLLRIDLGLPYKLHRSLSNFPPRTFGSYVQSLSPWEKHLLEGINFHYAPYEIMHYALSHEQGQPIYLVSDGSQSHESITYGWVCGTSTGTIYAEHSGFGYGTLTSHRAEAWGALSAILFVQKLLQYTEYDTCLTERIQLVGFSDNSGLITRLTRRNEYDQLYPNSTLDPDWDIVEQIHTISKEIYPATIEYSWVRGHQDNTSDELDVEARYNVIADKLASQVTVPHYIQSLHSPWVLPAEKCQFRLGARSIHGHYSAAIRTAYGLPSLMRYLQQRHNWHSDTSALIDWPAFNQAASTTSISSIQLTKLVYEKLPTRYELSKVNRLQSPLCPSCQVLETFTHLLQCSCEQSSNFRTKLQATIQKYLQDKGFEDHHIVVIRKLLSGTLPQISLEEHKTSQPTAATQMIEEDQLTIGLHLAPKGFLPVRLRQYVNTIYRSTVTDSGTRALDTIAGLIRIVWETQMALWQDYQAAQFSTSTVTTTRIQENKQECILRIRKLHAKQHLCLASHRARYFHPDVEEFLSSATLPQMRSYLHHYEMMILHSIKQADKITTRPLSTFPGFKLHSPAPRTRPPSTTYPTTGAPPAQAHKMERTTIYPKYSQLLFFQTS